MTGRGAWRRSDYSRALDVIAALPELVRETRTRRRLSLRHVSALTGVSLNTLSRFERRIGTVQVETVTALIRLVADRRGPTGADVRAISGGKS